MSLEIIFLILRVIMAYFIPTIVNLPLVMCYVLRTNLEHYHLLHTSSNPFEVAVCYDFTGQGHSGIFCDFNGGNRTSHDDGSPC